MKNRYLIILAFLAALVLSLQETVYAQKEKPVSVSSVIVDGQGNPLSGASVFSDGSYALTDVDGSFKIKVQPGSRIIVEAKGFEQVVLSIDDARNMAKISLKKISFKYGEDEKVDVAFRQVYEGDVVGFISKLDANSVNAVDNILWAADALSGRTLGLLGGNTIRGIGIGISAAELTGSGLSSGNALFVVDGLPRDITSLRLSEVEDITILKDVNAAALYGSAALNGVVLITTKRGQAYKKTADFKVNYGISTPKELPVYLNSADYMTQFNTARVNDGLAPLYSDATIDNFRNGNKYHYPSIDFYSSEYLKSSKEYFDLTSEFSGGNDLAEYYANMGWYSAGGLLNFGEGKNARNNIFNVRANVDLKINNWIKTSVDGSSIFGNNKMQRGRYWAWADSIRPYEFVPLLPFNLIRPDNSLFKGHKTDVDGKYLLGGNTNFITNAIADCYAGGVVENISRKFSFNNRVDFDLNKFVKGLTFHTNISFDYFTAYTQTIANQYSVYEGIWNATGDSIVNLVQSGTDARPGTQVVGGTTFKRRNGFYGLFNYDRTFSDRHHITGSLLAYGSSYKEQGDFQIVKQAHVGLQLGYSFSKKYMVDFSSVLVNSVELPKGNKVGFSPSLGLSWVVSSEDFMKSVTNVDYLKLRLSGGIMNSDLLVGGYYYYDNRYTTSGSYAWYEGGRSRSGVVSSWLDNPNLTFGKRNELNFGVEGLFFDKFLGIEANFFYDVYSDQVIRPTASYPNFYTSFTPYKNYNSDSYKGAEVGVNFNKAAGEWKFQLGLNTLLVTSNRTKVDEIYNNAYQYRKGHPVDATFGLESLGLFQDQTEIDNSPKQLFGTVKPGDIKYKDQNGDGYVDANDEVYLRRYQAPVSGGLTLLVSFKDLSLFILGEGRAGSESFKESDYYWIDGNKKYSEVVLGAWTPDTKTTATYPRLSSLTNSNNFRRSSYWLYNNDYFSVNEVQLTWNVPVRWAKSLMMKNMNLYVQGQDLYQFAKNRQIRDLRTQTRDPRTNNEPYYRTFSVGLKANF